MAALPADSFRRSQTQRSTDRQTEAAGPVGTRRPGPILALLHHDEQQQLRLRVRLSVSEHERVSGKAAATPEQTLISSDTLRLGLVFILVFIRLLSAADRRGRNRDEQRRPSNRSYIQASIPGFHRPLSPPIFGSPPKHHGWDGPAGSCQTR